MVQEEREKFRVLYTGDVEELYSKIVSCEGVVREEYVLSHADEISGTVVDSVWFGCDIVFDSTVTSSAAVRSAVRDIAGVENVKRTPGL